MNFQPAARVSRKLIIINDRYEFALHLQTIRNSTRANRIALGVSMQKSGWATATAGLLFAAATPALAAPGLGNDVYGARVEKGEWEFEAKFDTLAGGPDDGEDVVKLEAAYGVTDNLRIAPFVKLEKEPGVARKAEEVGVELVYELGSAGPIDFAIYGEYAFGLNGHADEAEAKLIMQHTSGPWDARLNLIFGKELERGHDVEIGYAASVDVETFDEVRLGVQAFGELGTFKDFVPRKEHFLGPVAKIEIEGLGPEMELEIGYLFALAAARDDAKGQFRLGIELEF